MALGLGDPRPWGAAPRVPGEWCTPDQAVGDRDRVTPVPLPCPECPDGRAAGSIPSLAERLTEAMGRHPPLASPLGWAQ